MSIEYQIWAGPVRQESVDGDDPIFYDVGLHALAKRTDFSDYEVANERICLRLGQALGLPIPAGVGLTLEGRRYFCSMICAVTGHRLPPGDPKLAVENDLRGCTGAVVFDAWIGNSDRHEGNFHFDDEANQLYLIDQGRGLFGPNGTSQFDDRSGKLGIMSVGHALAANLTSWEYFDEWESRIVELPEFLIADAVQEGLAEGVEQSELVQCLQFLLQRRAELRDMFVRDQAEPEIFPRIEPTLFPITSSDDSEPATND